MIRHMCGRGRVTGGAGGRDGRFVLHCSGRNVRIDSGFLRLSDGRFAASPGSRHFDRTSGAWVGAAPLKEKKDMLGASGGPCGKVAVHSGVKRTAAMPRDESAIAHDVLRLFC